MIIGTRPEVIKCFPVMEALRADGNFEVTVVFTGQHKELLSMMVDDLNVKNHTNLNIFQEGQSLSSITCRSLEALDTMEEFQNKHFDYCLVQGDTTTVFAGALWAFYNKIPVGHIEAGLRSGNLWSPYPEEANRKMVSVIADYHFAPTEEARNNLLKEGINKDRIFVTGNTVIDALRLSLRDGYRFQSPDLQNMSDRPKVLLTAHRRENQEDLEDIFRAVLDSVKDRDVEVIFPMHPTPRVRNVAKKVFNHTNVRTMEPLCYHDMVHLLQRVECVVTDSGGLQEEAPGFGKPVLVIRKETERPEGIRAGTCKLVGTDYDTIRKNLEELLDHGPLYQSMTKAVNPYGDGYAAQRITKILKGE